MSQVEFYFDYVSPYSYLAQCRLDLISAWGGEVLLRPVFLGGIMQTLGSTPPMMQPGAGRAPYLLKDVQRWADMYGVSLQFPAQFPFNTLKLLRATPFARDAGLLWPWMRRCFHAAWGEGRDVADPSVFRQLCEDVGLSPSGMWEAAQAPENKQWLKDATDGLIARGAFGVPTFFVGDEMFFGNDRLVFISRMLAGYSPES